MALPRVISRYDPDRCPLTTVISDLSLYKFKYNFSGHLKGISFLAHYNLLEKQFEAKAVERLHAVLMARQQT